MIRDPILQDPGFFKGSTATVDRHEAEMPYPSGLEDNVRHSRTELARDNAHLVERTVRIAHELQLEPATPAQARERLGTRGRMRAAVPVPVVAQEKPVCPAPDAFAAAQRDA